MKDYNADNMYDLADAQGNILQYGDQVVWTPTKKPTLIFGEVVGFAEEVLADIIRRPNKKPLHVMNRRVILRSNEGRTVYCGDMNRVWVHG